MNRMMRATMLVALSGVLSLPVLAQHAPPPPNDRPPGEPDAQPDGQPDQGPEFKDRLQQRLVELTREQDRLRRAIELIDKGAPREEVIQALRPPGDGPDSGDRPRDRWRDRREGRGPGDGDRPPGPDWRDPEQRERVMNFVRENLPEVAAKYEQLKATNPELAERILSRIGPKVGEIMAIREKEPDFAKLKTDELGNGLAIIAAMKQAKDAQGDAEKLKAARAVLVARVSDQFEIRTRLRQHEIDKLRQRLDRLESDLQDQVNRRDAAIEKSVDDMMAGKTPMDVLGDGPGRGPRPGGRDRPNGDPREESDEPPPPGPR